MTQSQILDLFYNKTQWKGECCIWTAAKDSGGYGCLTVKGKHWRAHRFIYLILKNGIDPNLSIDHLCRNRACVNIKHLEQVSIGENVLRGTSPPAQNSKKTHCIHGHQFTPENTYIRKKGKRGCKQCYRDVSKRIRKTSKYKKYQQVYHKCTKRQEYLKNVNLYRNTQRELLRILCNFTILGNSSLRRKMR